MAESGFPLVGKFFLVFIVQCGVSTSGRSSDAALIYGAPSVLEGWTEGAGLWWHLTAVLF